MVAKLNIPAQILQTLCTKWTSVVNLNTPGLSETLYHMGVAGFVHFQGRIRNLYKITLFFINREKGPFSLQVFFSESWSCYQSLFKICSACMSTNYLFFNNTLHLERKGDR